MTDLSCANWRKSSRSGSGDNCVEVARVSGAVAVRDSKNPAGGALVFSTDAFRRAVAAVKSRRHDL